MERLKKDLEEVCMSLSEDLSKVNRDIKDKGLTASNLDYVDKLTHAIKSVKTTQAMMGSSHDMSRDSYRMSRDYSNADSYYNNSRDSYDSYDSYRGRDAMGRYTRDSRQMVEEMNRIKKDIPQEMQYEFDKFIQRVEQM